MQRERKRLRVRAPASAGATLGGKCRDNWLGYVAVELRSDLIG